MAILALASSPFHVSADDSPSADNRTRVDFSVGAVSSDAHRKLEPDAPGLVPAAAQGAACIRPPRGCPQFAPSPKVAMKVPRPGGEPASTIRPKHAPGQDEACRRMMAEKLAAKGCPVDWQQHSVAELLDISIRVQMAEELNKRGVQLDWHEFSAALLLDLAARPEDAARPAPAK